MRCVFFPDRFAGKGCGKCNFSEVCVRDKDRHIDRAEK